MTARRTKSLDRALYSAVSWGSPLAVVGSSGLLEIAIHGGDAAKTLILRPGTQVLVA